MNDSFRLIKQCGLLSWRWILDRDEEGILQEPRNKVQVFYGVRRFVGVVELKTGSKHTAQMPERDGEVREDISQE